jgi:hypothetical protein
MSFTVEVERRIRVVQGLPSPVRAKRGLQLIRPGERLSVVVRVAVAFGEEHLDERGRFLDTDAITEELDDQCERLAAQPWTDEFPFRPTFELVARDLFGRLSERIPQLVSVELHDETFGTRTRYRQDRP